MLYAIREYDHGVATGYRIGHTGPLIYSTKREAAAEAARLNALPCAAGRVYRAERIED